MIPTTAEEAAAIWERNARLCDTVRASYESRWSGWNGDHTANRESDADGWCLRRLHAISDAESIRPRQIRARCLVMVASAGNWPSATTDTDSDAT